MSRTIFFVVVAYAIQGCGTEKRRTETPSGGTLPRVSPSPEPTPTAPTKPADASAQAVAAPVQELPAGALTIVSPAVCTASLGHLVDCRESIETQGVTLSDVGPGDFKTIVRPVFLGDCWTPYPLELSVTLNGKETLVRLQYGREITLRTVAAEPVRDLEIRNVSTFRKYAAYASSCRVGIEVSWNVPDVD